MTSKKSIPIRIIKWAGIVLGALALLLLLATWSINREPVQKRIHDTVTQRLHGAATFQHFTFVLLPRPHVLIDRIIISTPGRVSGSVRSAAIYPEIWPLFTGKFSIARVRMESPEISVKLVEEPGAGREDAQTAFYETRAGIESAMTTVQGFAPDVVIETAGGKVKIESDGHLLSEMSGINGTVALVRKGFDIRLQAEASRWGHVAISGALYIWKHSIAVRNLSLSGARSSLSELSARFSWRKTPYLDLRSGTGAVALEDVYERRTLFGYLRTRLQNVKRMAGTVKFTEMNFVGPLLHADQWKLQTAGMLENIFVDSQLLPGPLRIGQGRFQATTNTVILTNTQASLMDSAVSGAASFIGPYNEPRSLAVSVEGKIGKKMMTWALKKFNLPLRYVVRAPFWLSRTQFTWEKGEAIALAGTAAVNGSVPRLSIDLRRTPGEFVIRHLTIESEKERAVLNMRSTAKALDITFTGRLSEATVTRIFERSVLEHGWIQGDFQSHLVYGSSRESSANGTLEAADLSLQQMDGPPLTIKHVLLNANNRTITVRTGSFLWENFPFDLKGGINAAGDGFHVDMNANVETISADSVERALALGKKDGQTGGPPTAGETQKRIPVLGTIWFHAKSFAYGKYLFNPMTGIVFLDRNSVRVAISDAKVCGVSLPGHLQPINGKILLDVELSAHAQDLEPVVNCLLPNHHITGLFDLTGRVHALGASGNVVQSLQGQVNFTAKDGKFYGAPVLARIFAFLNVTELLRGKLPDLGRDGFKYKSIKVKGDIRNGKLVLRQAAVEGATLNIAADGEIDFGAKKVDMTVLVAPFKTIEYIISKIPLIRSIFGNKLITIPVRVSGDLDNPDITPLDPAAVGQNLLNIMKGILELPFTIIKPLIGAE